MTFFDKIIKDGKHYLLSPEDITNLSGVIQPDTGVFNSLSEQDCKNYLQKIARYTACFTTLHDLLEQFIFNAIAYPDTNYRSREAINRLLGRVAPKDLVAIAMAYPVLARGVTLEEIQRSYEKTCHVKQCLHDLLYETDALKQSIIEIGNKTIDLAAIRKTIENSEASAFIKWRTQQLSTATNTTPCPLTLHYKEQVYSASIMDKLMENIKQDKLYLLGEYFFRDDAGKTPDYLEGYFNAPLKFIAAVSTCYVDNLKTDAGIVEQVMFNFIVKYGKNADELITHESGISIVHSLSETQLRTLAKDRPDLLIKSNKIQYTGDYSELNIIRCNLENILLKSDLFYKNTRKIPGISINLLLMCEQIYTSMAYALIIWKDNRKTAEIRHQRFNEPFPLIP